MKKIRSSKKKVIKKEEPPVFFIQETIKLTFTNGRFERNDIYVEYMKTLRRNGGEVSFKIYSAKIQ
jgi:hypothetical protein